MNPNELWSRFKQYYFYEESLDLALDISRMSFESQFLEDLEPQLQEAYAAMAALEAGAIANPDEKRMVGHYWLRAPQLAPEAIGPEITQVLDKINTFAGQVHEGEIAPERGGLFNHILVVGIGGSALGPQFVTNALSEPGEDKCAASFFDNTDPDGLARVLAAIGSDLKCTLTIVISKSGGTKETRNGMLTAQAAYEAAGLNFGRHAVAITEAGSLLDKVAEQGEWLARFPMFDWIGGRTSELSAVGLLPAALQGFDIKAMLQGAAAMDVVTRRTETARNPAALLAAMWYFATGGKGERDMVILPYKDRLELFSRYLQQLVMESLGKKLDFQGNVVHQGIAVYGNKGSTDQHAYVQQLRDGVANFFVTFIEVLEGSRAPQIDVEPGVTSADFLSAFLYGTRKALFEGGRGSLTLTIPRVDASTVGQLIALFERAVGFYGSLVKVNAYNQPGVEAGKKAGQSVIEMQGRILEVLKDGPGDADSVAVRIGSQDKAEDVFHILRHLAASGRVKPGGAGCAATYVVK